MEILNYSFDGEGMQRVFENEKWTIGIKNWKPANDITGINNLERHNKTDELFVLVAGSCTLIYANDPKIFFTPLAAIASVSSAIFDDGVIG